MYAFTHAIRKILLLYPDYKVIIAGRDELIKDNKLSMRVWMSDQLSAVSDRVLFTGAISRDEVNEIMGKSEICIVPSLWENYPMVVLEAMAAGCAIAAAKRGGIPEIITDNQNGLLFNPNAPKDIFRAVNSLLIDEPYRLQLANAGRIRVQQLNSKELHCSITEEYQKYFVKT